MSEFPIPDAALDDRLGFVGTAGSGKTYNAGAAVERLIQSGARVVIVDPLDVWWGLRLEANGKDPAFALPIFGGAHGDLPLNERAGKLIGETVASMAESCIVSLGGLPTKEAERRFMLDFLETLYRKSGGSPFHVVFDEADLWAPQGAGSGSGPMLQALMEQIVRRGRVKGFIPWLITQRPAVISKDVLSQVDGLVVFKLTSSHDRKAIGEWVRGQADLEEWNRIWASLPTLQQGQGVVWVPARGVLASVSFPVKQTFDSSRSPKRGERRETRDLTPLNLDTLKARLSAIEDEAKASDPAVLKAEVARLSRELAKAQRQIKEPPKAERIVVNAEEIDAARADGQRVGYGQGIAAAEQAVAALATGQPRPVAARHPRSNGDARPVEPTLPRPAPVEGVTGPQQRILDALAWWAAFGIDAPTSEQVAFLASYSPSSSGFANLKGAMRAVGLIDYPSGGKVALTEAGREKANPPSVEVNRDAFHAAVRAKMSNPQLRLLNPLIGAYPEPLASSALAEAAGYSPSSSGYANLKGSMRSLGFLDYPSAGHVRAADWLFP